MAMGRLSKKDVRHVADLAKLKLTSPEISKYQKQLSDVVAYVSELSEVDTSGVEPTSQTTGLTNIQRQDEVKAEGLTWEEALAGTEKTHNGFFVVPQVFDKKAS
jgi:aspartyl-tRNA(Asn)/glutamyl-tRNA(Gln) amidotransferase subunit C